MASWLDPSLSLSSEIQQENDRRAAVRMSHQDLQIVADKLIVDWYRQQTMLKQALRQVSILEVQLMLARAEKSRSEPSEQHYRWAKELLGEG